MNITLRVIYYSTGITLLHFSAGSNLDIRNSFPIYSRYSSFITKHFHRNNPIIYNLTQLQMEIKSQYKLRTVNVT